jgi:hypothetical protein
MPATETASLGAKEFDFYVYQATDTFDELSYPKTIRIYEPLGDRTEQKIAADALDSKITLKPSREWEFDSLEEYHLLKHTSRRGKRRTHILTLAAKHLKRDVKLVKPMLDKKDCKRFNKELTLLFSIIQGVRVQFPSDSRTVFYQLNNRLYHDFLEILEDMGRRTCQISLLSEFDSLLPLFGDSDRFPKEGTYNKNDWEILACAFKCEAESYLKVMLELGFDFRSPEPLEEAKEETDDPKEGNDDDPDAIPGAYITKTPVRVNSMILDLTSGRKSVRELFSDSSRSYLFKTDDEESDDEGVKDLLDEGEPSSPSPTKTQIRQVTPSREKKPEAGGTDSPKLPPSILRREGSTLGIKRSVKTLNDSPEIPNSYNPFSRDPSTDVSKISPTVFENMQTNAIYGSSYQNSFEASGNPPEVNSDRYAGLFRPIEFDNNGNSIAPSPGSQSRSYQSAPNHQPIFNRSRTSRTEGNPGDPNDPDESDDEQNPRKSSSNENPSRGGDRNSPNRNLNGNQSTEDKLIRSGNDKKVRTSEVHFDTKLKVDIVPTWDGDEIALGKWIAQVNELAQRSKSVFEGLGDVVPTRFKDKAREWWYSLDEYDRLVSSKNWYTLRERIRTYWMNQSWINRMQSKAIRARFREPGHGNESPSEYYIRKVELITLVYNFTHKQIINEILKTAPTIWQSVLQPMNLHSLQQFQTALKFNEENLNQLVEQFEPRFRKRDDNRSPNKRPRTFKVDSTRVGTKGRGRESEKTTNDKRTYTIGWVGSKPQYPKDDNTISKGRTPEEMGARPCHFCGSSKHWDRDCKYASRNRIRTNARLVNATAETLRAEIDYQEAYLASINSDHEDPGSSNNDDDESDSEYEEPVVESWESAEEETDF